MNLGTFIFFLFYCVFLRGKLVGWGEGSVFETFLTFWKIDCFFVALGELGLVR